MTTPIPAEDLPKALVEVMGWTTHFQHGDVRYHHTDSSGTKVEGIYSFNPHLSHDHVQLAIEECFKRGLGFKYIVALSDIGVWEITDGCIEDRACLASPTQKARAALAAITGK